MKDFDESELEKLSKLARIKLTKAEKEDLLPKLTSILDYIEQLSQLDTEDLPPTNHVLETQVNVFREDSPIEGLLPRSVFLSNAPDQVSGMIRIPPVINKDSS